MHSRAGCFLRISLDPREVKLSECWDKTRVKMDTDPLHEASRVEHKKTNKRKPGENSCKNANSCINLVICVLCIVSVSSSIWREFELNTRLAFLEDRVESLEVNSAKAVDSLVERIRREAVYHLKRRVTRDLRQPVVPDEVVERATRDAPECVCPAGK